MTKPVPIAGYLLTDQRGELSTPVRMCVGEGHRCIHAGVHDWHYFYCAAQDADNKHAPPGEFAYPWPGAGKHLHAGPYPNRDCPYANDPPAVTRIVASHTLE